LVHFHNEAETTDACANEKPDTMSHDIHQACCQRVRHAPGLASGNGFVPDLNIQSVPSLGRRLASAFLLGLLQAALITGLLVNQNKHRQGEPEATLIAAISPKFVNLPSSGVDPENLGGERALGPWQ
jgi:hypothetical protein